MRLSTCLAFALILPASRTPDTERLIVHFKERPFDLAAFREATRVERNADLVARTAARLERSARDHQRAFVAAIERLGGRVHAQWWLINAAAVELPAGKRDDVAKLPGVLRIEPDRIHMPAIKTSTDNRHHAADALQATGIRGAGTTVAVLDTGQNSIYTRAGGCPCNNPYPGLPVTKPLAAGTWHAIEVRMARSASVTGFSLWCAEPAGQKLSAAIYADNRGRPGRVLGATTLTCSSVPAFARATLSRALAVKQGQVIYLAVQTAARSRLTAPLARGTTGRVFSGPPSWKASTLALAWKLHCAGIADCRPHRTYSNRLVLNTQVGALPANDAIGHGTAVASVAAGANWGTPGADDGHAPLAKIAGYSLPDFANGGTLSSTIVSAWQKVACDRTRLDIDVAVFSYTDSPNPLAATQQALDAVAYNADVVITAAAGNNGSSVATSPAAVNGIAVGACDASKNILASSSRGLVSGQRYPDLSGHGASVRMAQTQFESLDFIGSGTSFAAPQVAGAACLLRGFDRSLTALETRAILLASAEASPGSGATQVASGPGCGYLRDDAAIKIARSRWFDSGNLTRSRPMIARSMQVKAATRYQFAVAWFRHDTKSLRWSNIDLTVRDSRNNVVVSSRSPSNNEEFVRFTPRTNDVYRIEIVAARFDAPVIKIAWAATGPTGDAGGGARYSEFDTGCKGSGTGGGCPALKQSPLNLDFCPGLPPKTTFAMLVQCPCSLTIQGFKLYCKSSQPSTPVDCYVFMSSPTYPYTPLAVPVRAELGGMTVGTTAAEYAVTFSTPLTLTTAQAANFYIAITTPADATIWADNGTDKKGPHWMRAVGVIPWTGGTGYQNTITQYAWHCKVTCVPGPNCPGGPAPVIDPVGLPILGNLGFGVKLANAKPNSAAVLMTGVPMQCLDLRTLGAQACSLCCNAVVYSGVPTDAKGQARVPFPIPQLKGVDGAEFVQQWLVLDRKANRLGLTLSGPGRGRVGR